MYISLPEYALYSIIDGSKVDMLKHGIPDPSMVSSEHFQAIKCGKEWRYDILAPGEEFLAILIFEHF